MKKQFFGLSVVSVVLTLVAGCGDTTAKKTATEVGNPDTKTQLVSDEEIFESISQEQLADVAAAAGADSDTSMEQVQFGLTEGNSTDKTSPISTRFDQFKKAFNPSGDKNGFSRSRSCSVDGAKAVVKLEGMSAASLQVSGKNFTRSLSAVNEYELVRSFEWEGKTVGCKEGMKFANIDWNAVDLKGLKLSETISRLRAKQGSLKNIKNSTERTFGFSAAIKGIREVAWIDAGPNIEIFPAPLLRKKEITGSLERLFSGKSKKGEEISLSTSSLISAENPIIVSIVRQPTTRKLLSRTIESGIVTDSHKDGSRIESVFNKVLMEHNEQGKCPVYKSGTIEFKAYAKEVAEPKLTSIVTFSDGEATIKIGNAEPKAYDIPECDDEDADRK